MPSGVTVTPKKKSSSGSGSNGNKGVSVKGGKKTQQKTLEQRVTDAVNTKNSEACLAALKSASAAEIEQLAKNKSLMDKIFKTFPKRKNKEISKILSKHRSFWDRLKDTGNSALDWVKDTAKSAGQWLNKTATSAVTKHVSPTSIMNIYSALSKGNFISKKTIENHKKANAEVLAEENTLQNALHGNSYYTSTGYIENQGSGGWDKIKYGASNLDNAGCGIFATFNVIKAVTGTTPTEADLVDIVAAYEKDGAIIHGAAGTSPKAIRAYLIKKGFSVETVNEFGDAKLNQIGERYKGFVTLKLNNKEDITAGGHYESISKEAKTANDRKQDKDANAKASNYKFSIHNGSQRGPHNSMPKAIETINGNHAFIFCILAVNKAVK